MRSLIFCLLLTGSLSFNASAQLTDEQKIGHLIHYVGTLDAAFIRNGSSYTSSEAMEHLRMKREKAGRRVKTAEDFIVNVASKSYMSGKPYMVRFRNGKEFSCEMVLRLELKKLEEGRSALRGSNY